MRSESGPPGELPPILSISPYEEEHMFSRFELIRWWEQKRLSEARVLVIGAGALGNEIIKNLALLGIGNVILVDFDRIEPSNLSRSVLFRERDRGRYKAEVAAERARDLYPGIWIKPLCVNAVTDLGLGVFYWADVIIGGLDNREARLVINQNSFRAGKPWIDGAIEVLNGVARVFAPGDGPCYECTMSQIDWKVLNSRKACTLLTREEMMSGKTPTTPTMASIIAGIQCQEALKLLHGLETISGKGYIFEGLNFNNDLIGYKRKPDCFSHECFSPLTVLDAGAATLTLGDALARIRADLGPDAVMEIRQDVLTGFTCSICGIETEHHASLGRIHETEAACPSCKEQRFPQLAHQFDGTEPWQGKTLAQLGIPPFDVFIGREGERQTYYLLDGDRAEILGPLAEPVVKPVAKA
ncbi:MAG TPA: ThiF family adenylyltransferase [Candidatus Ozemobacteraceae bacterium]|nr:ThiF family adenylyltransferase [Candidatus Ozemobacteraceae bacterium]